MVTVKHLTSQSTPSNSTIGATEGIIPAAPPPSSVKRRGYTHSYLTDSPDVLASRVEYEKRYLLITRLSQQLRGMRLANLIIAMLSVFASIIAAERVYSNRVKIGGDFTDLGKDNVADALKFGSTVFTLILCGIIFATRYTTFRIVKLKRQVIPGQNFFHTTALQETVLEMILAAIHCPMFCYVNLKSYNPQGLLIIYDWDSLLSTVMLFIRMRIAIRIALNETIGVETPTSRIVAKTMRIRFESYFAARQLLDNKPIITNLAVYALAVAMLSYAVRVAERPVCTQTAHLGSSPAPGCPWKDIESPFNALWLIFITSLTVGYGDLYPVTHFGRFIVVIAAVLGIVLIALVVTAVANLAKFNADEVRGRNLISRRTLAHARRALAGRVVGQAFLFYRDRLRNVEKTGSNSVTIYVTPSMASPAAEAGASGSGGVVRRRPRKASDFGPPTPAAVARLSAVLIEWHQKGDDWLNTQRPKDASDEVKNDIDELKDSILNLHAKLDAILNSEHIHAVKRAPSIRQQFGANSEYGRRDAGIVEQYTSADI
jgi:hypothetical protein